MTSAGSRLLLAALSRDGAAPRPERLRSALPSSSGGWTDGFLTLAWSGPPPVADPSLVCVLDGRVDGLEKLADRLGLAPDRPERILAQAWRRIGAALLEELSGEFALIVWDGRRGLAARDQLGQRPLVHAEWSSTTVIASEARDAIALLPSRPAPDEAAVAHWLAGSVLPAGRTLRRGVARLGAGSALRLERGARPLALRYWAPAYRGAFRGDAGEAVRTLLDDAVRRRMGDKTAVLLSGGLDSPTVAALARQHGPVATYSATFPDHPQTDESRELDELDPSGYRARSPARGLLAGVLRDQATWQAPPLGWGQPYIHPLLERAAREGAGVVLTGDGADELFGPRIALLGDLLARGRLGRAVAMTKRLPGAGSSPRTVDVARILARQGLARALPAAWQRFVASGPGAPDWLLPAAARSFDETDDPWSWKRLDGPRWWCHVAELVTAKIDALGFHDVLRRDSAVAGLEGRAPFFDLHLVELALSVPPELSFDPHLRKPLLRESVEGLLPDSIRLRPAKARFDDWLVDSIQAESPALQALLGGPDARILAFVRRERLLEALDAGPDLHPQGRFGWARNMWRALTAECWLRGEEDASFAERLLAQAAPGVRFSFLTPVRVVPTVAALTTTQGSG